MKESLAKMRMEDLKRAREEFEFHEWTYNGKIMQKDVNDYKIKTYYNYKIIFKGLLQFTINGNYMRWKSRSRYFVCLHFCFILGFWGLFKYATTFNLYFFIFHW